jgi:hypothetical protein
VTVDVPVGDEDLPGGSAAHGGFCPLCHGLPDIDLPTPTELPAPPFAAAAAPVAAPRGVIPLGARAPPYIPTGPPAYS